MKVSEFIQRLQELDQDKEIRLHHNFKCLSLESVDVIPDHFTEQEKSYYVGGRGLFLDTSKNPNKVCATCGTNHYLI